MALYLIHAPFAIHANVFLEFMQLLKSAVCYNFIINSGEHLECYEARTMKILVFLHGTTIMHRSAIGHSREECICEYETYVNA